MRILHFIPNLSGGGAERQLSYLAPELARMGHEIHVAFSKEGPRRPELAGVVLHPLKSRSNYDPYLMWQIMAISLRIQPDIIHTWILQMDILGGLAAKLNQIPWIFREPSSRNLYLLKFKSRLRTRFCSGAAAVVCNSKAGEEYWKNLLSSRRRYIIRNALPIHEIDGIAPALPTDLSKLKDPIVLYAGRLVSDNSGVKNLKAFLESVELVRRKQDALGVLCGEGPQQSELERFGQKLGLEGNIHFTGFLPSTSVWALMKKASVFVSLSVYEGCPNAVMEAMACGCPLVLSDIPAHRELLDETGAVFVDPDDIQQAGEAILQILADPEASKKRAWIAKQKTRGWSIHEMARKWEKVYLDVA